MAGKQLYAERGRALASIFASLADDILTWRNVYWDRGYNSGGADVIVDGDVTGAGIPATTVTAMVTFADALETFLVANRGYISKMRNDL